MISRKEALAIAWDWPMREQVADLIAGMISRKKALAIAWAWPMWEQVADLIMRIDSEAERRTARECAAAICRECAEGDEPVEFNDVITANGRPLWHEIRRSDSTKSGTWRVCDAAAIREKFLKETA